MPNRISLVILTVLGSVSPVFAEDGAVIPGIQAHLRPVSYHVPLNRPVWVRFAIENVTDEPITLTVPHTEPEIPRPEVGLPIQHIFSGGSFSGVVVATEAGRRWDNPSGLKSTETAPIMIVAPHALVGKTLDLRNQYRALRSAGQYRVTWSPYGGAVSSDSAVITIAPLKQVEMITDEGTMIMRFLYEDAPKTVENFIELARSGFYDGKSFHRLEPGYFVQGGCPRGDGTGIRLDGKRIPPEFNDHPHQKGSVSMALLGDDPESASCQFFICNTRQKQWDGKYTVFAQLVGEDSFATLDRIMAVPVDDQSRPERPIIMRSVRIVDAPPEAYDVSS